MRDKNLNPLDIPGTSVGSDNFISSSNEPGVLNSSQSETSDGVKHQGFLSLKQAAKISGYHQDYLGQLARSGKLKAVRIGRNWVTTIEAVNNLFAVQNSGLNLETEAPKSAPTIPTEIDEPKPPLPRLSVPVEPVRKPALTASILALVLISTVASASGYFMVGQFTKFNDEISSPQYFSKVGSVSGKSTSSLAGEIQEAIKGTAKTIAVEPQDVLSALRSLLAEPLPSDIKSKLIGPAGPEGAAGLNGLPGGVGLPGPAGPAGKDGQTIVGYTLPTAPNPGTIAGFTDLSGDSFSANNAHVQTLFFSDGSSMTTAPSGSSADNINVNGVGATDADFINSSASGTAPSLTWSINTVPSPDQISLTVGAASDTDAGVVTTGVQTFAGAKTFSSTPTLSALASGGNQCLQVNNSGLITATGSACGAGGGSPGGLNTQVQFNNSSAFGGSANLTFVSPALTIGASGSTTGQLKLAGSASGVVTIQPSNAAGTVTQFLPTVGGTFITTGNLTDITGLVDAQISSVGWSKISGTPTSLGGYGITDSLSNSATSAQDAHFGDVYLKDDTSPSHYLQITDAEDLFGAHTLSLSVGNADRTLTINGNATLNNWFDQSVKTTASPTFVAMTLSGSTGGGNQCLHVDNSGVVSATGTDCGAGGGSTALDAITAASAAHSISNGDNAQTWNWTLTTAAKSAFTFGEAVAATNGVGAQNLLRVNTLAASTANPLFVTAGGTANGVKVDTNGLLQAIGTGGVQATTLSCTGCVNSTNIADGTIVNGDLAAGSFSNITGVGSLSSLTVTSTTATGNQVAVTDNSLTTGTAQNISFTNNSGAAAGNTATGLQITENAATNIGNTSNLLSLSAGSNGTVNGVNIGSATGFTNFLKTPSIVIDSSGNVTGAGTFNTATISGGTLTAAAVNGVTTANIVVTSGSYADPAWITSLAWSKISGTPTTLGSYGITDALSNSATSVQDAHFGDVYLKDDTSPSHYLQITDAEDLTGAHSLSLSVGNANRTLTINGNVTLNDWFDQSVKTTASPTFSSLTLSSALTVGNGGTGIGSGTSGGVPYFSSSSTIASSAALGAGQLVLGGGAGSAPISIVNPANSVLLTTGGSGVTWGSTSANLVIAAGSMDTVQGIQTSSTPQFARLGLGAAANATTTLTVTGATLNADADGTIAGENVTATVTKNDSNTRTFPILQIKPTLNAGGSNTTTTVNLLSLDTVNTSVTGVTTNLLKASYGGTQKFLVDSTGAITSSSLAGGGAKCLHTDNSGVITAAAADCGSGGGMSIGGAVTSGTGGSLLYVDGSNNLAQDNSNLFYDTTNHYLGLGINASLKSRLNVVGSTTASGADAIAGTYSNLTLTNSTGSGFEFGNRTLVTVNGSVAGTEVGNFIRMTDNTSLVNTVRGLEVQAYSGSNTAGVNTGIAAYGKTFGIQGTTTSEAGSVSVPAAVFADLDNGAAPTVGNAIRAYSNDVTSSDLVSFYQETTAFSGNGLIMNFGNSGSFTGNFFNLQNAGTTKFHVTSAGDTFVSLPGTQNTIALCHSTNGQVDNDEIVDCSGAPSDIAEWYAASSQVAAGDIVALTSETFNYASKGSDPVTGTVSDLGPQNISILGKATTSSMFGIVSTAPYQVFGEDIKDSIKTSGRTDIKAVPIALKGRVPVKVSEENGPIHSGDALTISKTLPGYAMKLTASGISIGTALEDSNPSMDKILAFVDFGFHQVTVGTGSDNTKIIYNQDLDLSGQSLLNVKAIASANGKWSIDENGNLTVETITAKKLCLEDVCITKDQLQQLLNNSSGSTSGATNSDTQTPPTPDPTIETTETVTTGDTTTPVDSTSATVIPPPVPDAPLVTPSE